MWITIIVDSGDNVVGNTYNPQHIVDKNTLIIKNNLQKLT